VHESRTQWANGSSTRRDLKRPILAKA
jgi:hypothetical protein